MPVKAALPCKIGGFPPKSRGISTTKSAGFPVPLILTAAYTPPKRLSSPNLGGKADDRFLLFLRRVWPLLLIPVVVAFFTSKTGGASVIPPGPTIPVNPATHMAFVNFPESEGGGVTTQLYPLGGDDLPMPPLTPPLFSQPDPPGCQTDTVYAAPTGQALVLQYNCEDTLFARLLNLLDPSGAYTTLNQGYFMNWAPDGQWLLFRDIETNQVSLVPLLGGDWQLLNLPPHTYSAVFAPDGQTVLYAASAGLSFGSEIGSLNLADGGLTPWQTFPDQVVAHPIWSPDGSQLAYVLFPDTNIPFIIGELWLADPMNGAPLTLLAEVDAGHGYSPIWSPNGNSLIYVHRENPDDIQADIDPLALHSNLHQVEISSGTVTTITQFSESLVYDTVWWPDGNLAFTVNDTIWTWTPSTTPIQASPPGSYRHPVWLSLPIP